MILHRQRVIHLIKHLKLVSKQSQRYALIRSFSWHNYTVSKKFAFLFLALRHENDDVDVEWTVSFLSIFFLCPILMTLVEMVKLTNLDDFDAALSGYFDVFSKLTKFQSIIWLKFAINVAWSKIISVFFSWWLCCFSRVPSKTNTWDILRNWTWKHRQHEYGNERNKEYSWYRCSCKAWLAWLDSTGRKWKHHETKYEAQQVSFLMSDWRVSMSTCEHSNHAWNAIDTMTIKIVITNLLSTEIWYSCKMSNSGENSEKKPFSISEGSSSTSQSSSMLSTMSRFKDYVGTNSSITSRKSRKISDIELDLLSVEHPEYERAFKYIKTVGRGSFGVACLYKRLNDDIQVVLKQINLMELTSGERVRLDNF